VQEGKIPLFNYNPTNALRPLVHAVQNCGTKDLKKTAAIQGITSK